MKRTSLNKIRKNSPKFSGLFLWRILGSFTLYNLATQHLGVHVLGKNRFSDTRVRERQFVSNGIRMIRKIGLRSEKKIVNFSLYVVYLFVYTNSIILLSTITFAYEPNKCKKHKTNVSVWSWHETRNFRRSSFVLFLHVLFSYCPKTTMITFGVFHFLIQPDTGNSIIIVGTIRLIGYFFFFLDRIRLVWTIRLWSIILASNPTTPHVINFSGSQK